MLSIKSSGFIKPTLIFDALMILIIGSTLVISDFFIYASLTPFLLFIQSITLLILFLGIACFSKSDIKINVNITHILIVLVAGYILINGLFINKGINSYHTYLLFCCGFFICLSFLLNIFPDQLYTVLLIILSLALLGSVICIGQYLGMLNSQSHFFKVTGTWENPNITAMFIVMAVPAFFATIKSRRKFSNNIAWVCFFILCLSLIILDCRTAWVSLGILLFIYLNKHYSLLSKYKAIKQSKQFIISLLVIALILFSGDRLYQHKKASADGRLLIWKISTKMIADKPFIGFGYGSFEREYNLYQAEYFKHQQANAIERANAGYVHMAYNEFLQTAVEGGFIGLLLLCGVFYSLLRLPVFKNKKTKNDSKEAYLAAYCGVVIFIVMSLINFTIQAIPAMCVLIVYGAILASGPYQRQIVVISNSSGQYKTGKINTLQVIGCMVFLAGLGLTVSVFQIVKANYINKQAALVINSKDKHIPILMLEPLAGILNNYESYWTNYGNILLKEKDYANALLKYNRARQLTSNPDLYLKTGICYEQLGDPVNAIKSYQQSSWLNPNKMEPRFAQMRLYWKLKDTVNATRVADEILTIPIKIVSNRAYYYQQQAMQLLKTKPMIN